MEIEFYKENREHIIKVLDAVTEVQKKLRDNKYFFKIYTEFDEENDLLLEVYAGNQYSNDFYYKVHDLIKINDMVKYIYDEIEQDYLGYMGVE